jgi:predicted transcriptional regulator
MGVQPSPELEAKLDRIAAQQGCDAESLVDEALERLVGYDEWFVREAEKGLAQIERGEVLEHEEVGARIEKLASSVAQLRSTAAAANDLEHITDYRLEKNLETPRNSYVKSTPHSC